MRGASSWWKYSPSFWVDKVTANNKCNLVYTKQDGGTLEEKIALLKSKCDSELKKKVLDEIVKQGIKIPD